MNQTKKLVTLMLFIALLAFNAGKAQNSLTRSFVNYSFSADSLRGFEEEAAKASAISEGFLGVEFPVRMFQLKRAYINAKYHIKPAYSHNFNAVQRVTSVVPACVNEDFEATAAGPIVTSGQVNGWTVTGGSNSGVTGSNCTLLGCCPSPPAQSAIQQCNTATGFVDPVIGAVYPIYSVFGTSTGTNNGTSVNPSIPTMYGTNVIRINNETPDYSIEKLSKTFAVTASNALFQFAFMSVFYTGHACCDAGSFQIKLTNATAGTVITCPSYSIAAPSSQCTGTTGVPYFNTGSGTPASGSSTFIFSKWNVNSLDLTSYIGQNITIDIIVTDCTGGAHYGCVYFDAQCSPMSIIGNGTSFPAGTSSITLPTCGATGATITLPSGLGPYTWSSPAPGSYQTPSYANQTLITNLSAVFSVTMNPPGSCQPIIRNITTTITTAPSILANVVQPTCSSTVTTINISASSGVSPYTFSCTSGVTSATSPTANVTTPAVGVNTVSLVDGVGCVASTTVNVQATPVAPTFTLNPAPLYILDCTTPNIAMQVNVTAANTYSVLWSSVCQPTATGNNYNVTQPCTYSITVTDVVSNCVAGSAFTVTQNATVPTVSTSVNSLNLTCAANTATMSGSSNTNTNVLFEWIDPSGTSTTGSLVSVGAGGVYCFKVTNLLNGCSATKCVTVTVGVGFPTFITSSPSSYSLSCSTLTTQICVPGVTTSPTPGSTINYSIVPAVVSGTPATFNAISCSTNISVPGAYIVYVKDLGNNCVATQTINIISYTTSPQVSSNISAPSTPTLTCSNPTILAIGTSSTNNTVVSWIQPANQNVSSSMLAISNSTVATTGNSITSLGVFTVVATNTLTGCVTRSLVPVFNDKRIPTYSIVPGTNPPKVNCYGNPVILTGIATNTLYNTSTFTWTPPASGPAPLANSSYPAAVDGPYTVTGTFLPNGCTNTATFVVIPDYVIPVLTGLNTATLDCATNPTTAISAFGSPISGYTYTWSAEFTATYTPNNHAPSPIISVPGGYNVAVTNVVNGCINTGSVLVVNGNLVVDFTADPTTGFAPAVINFVNTSTSVNSNSIQSVWSFGNGTSANVNSTAGQSATYTQPGTYTVTLIGRKGSCIDSAYKVIRIDIPSKLDVPNVFTPNGDGSNDVFFLKTTNLTEITAYIFDRWGNKVYEVTSNTGNIAWDGKNQEGKEAAVGTYFYIIKATGKDGQAYDKKGNVSLYR